MLTARSAAARLGIGYSTMKQWIRQGSIRTTQTAGGHHRITELEVERLLAPHGAPPKPRGRDGATAVLAGLSGRNRLRGYVQEVRIDGLLGQVRLAIGDGVTLTAVITSDALTELRLRRGDEAIAIVKATDVMIAREIEEPVRPQRRSLRAKVKRRK